MLFSEKSQQNLDVLHIPAWVADRLICDAPEGCIKLYLQLLRLAASEKGQLDTDSIKSKLDIDATILVGAMAFLKEHNILDWDEQGVVSFHHSMQPAAPTTKPIESDRPPIYSATEISCQIKKNPKLSQMYSLVQCMLGKTISTASAATLYSFYDWLGMSPEVISAMVEYCVGLGKKDMRYMEKVAISWHQMGIVTVEMAEKYIKSQNKLQKYTYSIKRAFGIYDRNLTSKEEHFIQSWYEQLGCSPELAALAFEYCVNQTGKLSFAYINSILDRWHKEGIKTIEQAQNRNRPKTEKTAKSTGGKKDYQVYCSDEYDFDEIERAAARKLKQMTNKGTD